MDRRTLVDNITSMQLVPQPRQTADRPIDGEREQRRGQRRPFTSRGSARRCSTDRSHLDEFVGDVNFVAAVKAAGAEAIMIALMDRGLPRVPDAGCAPRGYEVYPVVDAVGGTSLEAHRAAISRIVHAKTQPITGPRCCASYSATGRAPRRRMLFRSCCSRPSVTEAPPDPTEASGVVKSSMSTTTLLATARASTAARLATRSRSGSAAYARRRRARRARRNRRRATSVRFAPRGACGVHVDHAPHVRGPQGLGHRRGARGSLIEREDEL